MSDNATFKNKLNALEKLFSSCVSAEERYKKIMEMAKILPPFEDSEKTESNLVSGCQSILYVHVKIECGKIFFNAFSEALISKGLAALLFFVYNNQAVETLFTNPPLFLKELQILNSLSPSRSNGVLSLFKKIQTTTLKLLSREKESSSLV